MAIDPKNISELVESLDRIREELLTIQRDLERMAPEETRKGHSPKTSGADGG
jgi:hypothetical protein